MDRPGTDQPDVVRAVVDPRRGELRRPGAYAAYGGIYIIASIGWLAVVERVRPLGSDWLGVALCVLGASVILFGPRFSAP